MDGKNIKIPYIKLEIPYQNSKHKINGSKRNRDRYYMVKTNLSPSVSCKAMLGYDELDRNQNYKDKNE